MAARVPPLDWVRVFEASARNESFTAAAKELSVTPGAVSRTVKELEHFLGVKLFQRLTRGVELTRQGREYAAAIAPAIDIIAEATTQLTGLASARVLRISAMPALAELWLVPRMGAFRKENPGISVEVSADTRVVDLPNSNFDLALRYGDGNFGGLEAVKLFDDELFPVASPALLQEYPLHAYQDLFKVPVLQDENWTDNWPVWLKAANQEIPSDWESVSFSLYSMALSAAVSGQGVAMGHRELVAHLIDSGQLIAPFDIIVKSTKSFYLVVNPNRPQTPAVEAFILWLKTQ